MWFGSVTHVVIKVCKVCKVFLFALLHDGVDLEWCPSFGYKPLQWHCIGFHWCIVSKLELHNRRLLNAEIHAFKLLRKLSHECPVTRTQSLRKLFFLTQGAWNYNTV